MAKFTAAKIKEQIKPAAAKPMIWVNGTMVTSPFPF
jgi:hypothetical protein